MIARSILSVAAVVFSLGCAEASVTCALQLQERAGDPVKAGSIVVKRNVGCEIEVAGVLGGRYDILQPVNGLAKPEFDRVRYIPKDNYVGEDIFMVTAKSFDVASAEDVVMLVTVQVAD